MDRAFFVRSSDLGEMVSSGCSAPLLCRRAQVHNAIYSSSFSTSKRIMQSERKKKETRKGNQNYQEAGNFPYEA